LGEGFSTEIVFVFHFGVDDLSMKMKKKLTHLFFAEALNLFMGWLLVLLIEEREGEACHKNG